MTDLEMIYEDLLNKDGLEYDASQFNAVKILNYFRIQILKAFQKNTKLSLLRYFFSPNYLKKKKYFIVEFIYMEV